MYYNRQLTTVRPRRVQQLCSTKAAQQQLPQITIRGDNNLINLGASGVIKVTGGGLEAPTQPTLNAHWPQQILDAIRLKAAQTRRSNEQVCELATRVLGRAVVAMEKLSARELARVYEAVCASQQKS
jgi:hypothetical protein